MQGLVRTSTLTFVGHRVPLSLVLEGDVCAVTQATERLVHDRFRLAEDARRLVGQATVARLLPASTDASADARRIADQVCR